MPLRGQNLVFRLFLEKNFVNSIVSNYLASLTDFGTQVCQTRVLTQNSNYSGVFLVAFVSN